MNIAAISAVLLALISDVFSWILGSWPFQFLGKISFSLYLIHTLLIYGLMKITKDYLVNELTYPAEDAILMTFFICTPVLLVVSWILEMLVDRPSKEFAGEFDRQVRRKRPRPMPTKNEDGELVMPSEEEFYSLA